MSRSKFNERNQGTRPPDAEPAAAGPAATDARSRAGGRPDTDDQRDVDGLLDAVLREMTRLDDDQADAEAARRIAAAVRATGAPHLTRQSGRPRQLGQLGQLAETMPRLAWATAALLLCAIVGGSLWWSTRQARPAAPDAAVAAVEAGAPGAPASTAASGTSPSASTAPSAGAPMPGSLAPGSPAPAAEPPRHASSPFVDASSPSLASPGLASAAAAPSRAAANSSASPRALSAGRAGRGRTAEASLREETQDALLGDPIDPLEVASIEPALLEEPAALETMPLATGRIAITPIRIDPFDAPVTPRSH